MPWVHSVQSVFSIQLYKLLCVRCQYMLIFGFNPDLQWILKVVQVNLRCKKTTPCFLLNDKHDHSFQIKLPSIDAYSCWEC